MPAATPPPHFESLRESAERYHVCTKTIRRRISEGKLKAYRFGPRMIRLDPFEVDALLQPIPAARSAA